MEEKTMIRIYFFGVNQPNSSGHFLYGHDGYKIYDERHTGLPFKFHILDGGLLPPSAPQDQGRIHMSIINDWTALTMWDRTGDRRAGSCAAFVAEGVFDLATMKEIMSKNFPELWTRIRPF